MRKILILGGTTDARRLAEHLATRSDIATTLSLAGRTAAPAGQHVPLRVGGFGGAQGLAKYLRDQCVDLLVDATHPYAAKISAHALQAADIARVELVAIRRPPWRAVEGDRWTEVADVEEAVEALGLQRRRAFLALGRQELAPFERAPQHGYLVRSVDPVDPPLAVPDARYVLGRGPFTEEDDRGLLVAHGIDVVVAKNSGGTATYGKIAAARTLGIEVLLLRRPPLPAAPSVESVSEAIRWIDHAFAVRMDRGV